MNSTTRSIVSILIAVVLVVASINIISVPASAASGDLEIVDVEEMKSGQSIDELSKNQPIEVTIDYSLTGQSSYTIGVYDDELGNFGNSDEITRTVTF